MRTLAGNGRARRPLRGLAAAGSFGVHLCSGRGLRRPHGVDVRGLALSLKIFAERPRVMARSRTPDYTVGYKKPPKHSQYQPGESGNPKGRPRKERQRAAMPASLSEESARILRLAETAKGNISPEDEAGLTWEEAVDLALFRAAAGGDIRAIKMFREALARARAERDALEAWHRREEDGDFVRRIAAALRADKLAENRLEAEAPVTSDAAAPAHATQHAGDYADEGEEEAEPCLVGTRRPAAPPPAAPSAPSAPTGREFSSGLAGAHERTHWQETKGHGVTPPRLSSRHARPASASGPLIQDTRPMTRNI